MVGRLLLALSDIKLAHSVFALPFAILGAFLVVPRGAGASIAWGTLAGMLVLVVLCMVFARTWAMLVNRVADRRLAAATPRTARRAFASGELSTRDGALLLIASALAFIACCALFGVFYGNWLPAVLALPVLLWIAFYSFTKRFTWLCHVFLGGALAASPIAAAIAVGPDQLMQSPAVFWIAGMVLCWVAGFDVIYALQDLDYDRGAGLHSIPAAFGWRGAAWISRALHAGALGCLVFAWRAEPTFGVIFLIGVAAVAGLLVWEHVTLAKRGRAGIPMAFFTLNGVVSLVLGAAGCIDSLM